MPPRPHPFARPWANTLALALLACWIACVQALAADTPAGEARFDIFEYRIEGNSKLSDLEIERAVSPHMGEARTVQDIEAARLALEATYRDAGYATVVVSIPEQQVREGLVTLAVVEGEVERLRVRGAQYHAASRIRERVPELAEGNVPYFPEMQRQIDALNRGADLKASPVLKAGRKPGTVDFSLDVDDQLPLHGSLELNNRQTAFTEPLRASASVRYDNLWQAGHSLGMTYQTAPHAPPQVKVFSLNYVMPVGRGGDALVLYALQSTSNVPNPPSSTLGNTAIAGFRYSMPLRGADDYAHSLSVGLDRKNVKLTAGTPFPPITYVPAVATYNGFWIGERDSTALEAGLTAGSRRWLGNDEADFAAKQPGASANYLVLKSALKRTQSIARWTVSARLEAQLASGVLVPNEQYAAGGAESVRGYKESERLGDDAVRVNLEVRAPSLALGGDASPFRLTLIGFYDASRLRRREAVTTIVYDRYKLRGTGIGMRLAGPRGFSMELDLARALDDGQVTRAGDNRLHSRLAWDF
jgi:hemolysin activation/secretion protein